MRTFYKSLAPGLLVGVITAMLIGTSSHAQAAGPVPPMPPIIQSDQILSGIVPDLPPGYMIIEGDIQVPIAEFQRRYRQWQDGVTAQAPGGTYETEFWPNGVVLYEFDPNVTAANQTRMQTAMQQWQNVSNVLFAQCPNNSCSGDYVHIQNAVGNSSSVGRQGGEQNINITSLGFDHHHGP